MLVFIVQLFFNVIYQFLRRILQNRGQKDKQTHTQTHTHTFLLHTLKIFGDKLSLPIGRSNMSPEKKKAQQEKDKFRKQTRRQAKGTAEAATRIKITRENMKRHRETKSPDADST